MDPHPSNPVVARLQESLELGAELTPAAALRMTFELAEAGTAMMRLSLQRQYPDASPEEIKSRLREWLHHRPGAEHGDSWGRPAPERIPRA